jgi:CRISPR/Cas system-associated exonuclease Cas4 (RecB family)
VSDYLIEIPEQESFIISLLEQDLLEEKETQVNKFRVSLAGQCFLKRILYKQGIPPSNPPSLKTLRIFEIGNIIHLYLQNFLEKHKLLILKEFELEDDKRIGHLDALVYDRKKIILYDFKTVSTLRFPSISGVSIFHVFQIVSYYEMLIKLFDLRVDSVRILYISKDDLDMREYEIDADKWVDVVLRDWQELYEFESGINKNFPRFYWECKYCIYKSLCEEKFENSLKKSYNTIKV